jgi:spermidine synthase
MGGAAVVITYCIFFLSGAAALIYEIVWSRYLSLVFGGSHLAITTVLTVFMAGLALGSYTIGRGIDGRGRLLRLFGLLELGVGFSALLFLGLMQIYPPVYVRLAGLAPESGLYLTAIRLLFAVVALMVPTTLMGGTLPVLTAFTARLLQGAGIRLSFLYGCNTIGAVCGAAATGFVMLRNFSMTRTLVTAMAISLTIGCAALLLQKFMVDHDGEELPGTDGRATEGALPAATDPFPFRLVAWGIGVSGFCAMAYEVLWNRILSIAIGASSYGFTLLLMAFLSGIGLGSAVFGIYCRFTDRPGRPPSPAGRGITLFGVVQVLIGVTALGATLQFRNLPGYVALLHGFFLDLKWGDQFQLMQLANFVLAFSFMFVPAFFMGVAFPLAGSIHCQYRRLVGSAVGELLSFNTVGAILGAGVSGYGLIYLFGIQRSLQLVILVNIGYGLTVIAATRLQRRTVRLVGALLLATPLLPVLVPHAWKLWEPGLFAVYQSNKPEEYGTPDEIKELLANVTVRYYAEGAQSIVSSVQMADTQFFITNGRVEASNDAQDMQCQYVLGHLPMLLHKNPRSVFVLGTGSGMTLGAVSVHPSVEKITLAEIEPGVLGVAKTFGIDNHYILNKPDPRLKVVFNDGRNHLLTTHDRYDVITADPVHPWFSGAGYLYSTEYFHLAASRLNPGGIICQWLPLYELTGEDLRSVVRTIRENFAYTMIWVTHYDAEIIASNSPIVIDEQELARRIANRQVLLDLRQISMGSAEDFLSYFVMGSIGTRDYARSGRINTDDNLYLEFSAPRSIGKEFLRGANLADLLRHRENLFPYLARTADTVEQSRQKARWEGLYQAALLDDRAHVLEVEGEHLTYEFADLSRKLEERYPRFAPWRFVKDDAEGKKGGTPKILRSLNIPLLDDQGVRLEAQLTAIVVRTDARLARIFFVDDASRTVFGKLRVRGSGRNDYIENFAAEIMGQVQTIYKAEAVSAAAAGKPLPSVLAVFPRIKTLVEARIDQE